MNEFKANFGSRQEAYTTGGPGPFHIAALAGTVTDVKASGAGQLYGVTALNKNAAVAFLQIFNVPAAQVTLGTTVPTHVIEMTASEHIERAFPKGLNLGGTGISMACTTTAGGNTAGSADVEGLYA